MYMCLCLSLCLWDQRGIGSPGFGVIGGCELPDGCSESNSYYLQEQYMFLTVDHRSSPLRVFFPLKLPLEVKGKILNVFSHTLKSAYDTPIPVLWFDSRSCCSLLPCTPQDIRSSSGLGFAACSPAHPRTSASLQGWALCPALLLTQSSVPWGVTSVVSFVQPSASEPQVGCKFSGMPSDHRQHFICQEYIFILVKEELQTFYSHYQSDWWVMRDFFTWTECLRSFQL